MKCLSQRWRRTSPMQSSSNELFPSKIARRNGWSWPPHILQVVGWLVIGYLAIVSFGIYIPLLPLPWNYVLYSVTGTAFIVHIFAHIAAVTIDPADASVRVKQSYSSPVPSFDRTKQPHVIQDLHCYLCDVNVPPKVKHCITCNKCVEEFDHHCKWLNTCVGGRNYWFFFVALSSAIVGVFLLVVVILFVFIEHYLDPNILRTAPQFNGILGNSTWLAFLPLAPIETSSAALLILAFLTVMLSIVCLILLCQLLGFHFYLFYKGISTYDYIKMQHRKEAQKEVDAQDTKSEKPHDEAKTPNKDTQNQDSSVDWEAALPQGSSICKFNQNSPLGSWISGSLCAELENLKKSTDRDHSFHYGTENPTQSTGNEDRNWKPDAEEEAQSSSVRSADGVPEMQDPLGSCVIISNDSS